MKKKSANRRKPIVLTQTHKPNLMATARKLGLSKKEARKAVTKAILIDSLMDLSAELGISDKDTPSFVAATMRAINRWWVKNKK